MSNSIQPIPFKRLFKGRISRLDFFLASILNTIPLLIFITLWYFYLDYETSPLILVFAILLLLINIMYRISLTIRRFHDTGKSGWFYLVTLVNPFLFFYLLFRKSESRNKYGSAHVYKNPLRALFNEPSGVDDSIEIGKHNSPSHKFLFGLLCVFGTLLAIGFTLISARHEITNPGENLNIPQFAPKTKSTIN